MPVKMIKEALWMDGWDRWMDGMVIIGRKCTNIYHSHPKNIHLFVCNLFSNWNNVKAMRQKLMASKEVE